MSKCTPYFLPSLCRFKRNNACSFFEAANFVTASFRATSLLISCPKRALNTSACAGSEVSSFRKFSSNVAPEISKYDIFYLLMITFIYHYPITCYKISKYVRMYHHTRTRIPCLHLFLSSGMLSWPPYLRLHHIIQPQKYKCLPAHFLPMCNDI